MSITTKKEQTKTRKVRWAGRQAEKGKQTHKMSRTIRKKETYRQAHRQQHEVAYRTGSLLGPSNMARASVSSTWLMLPLSFRSNSYKQVVLSQQHY